MMQRQQRYSPFCRVHKAAFISRALFFAMCRDSAGVRWSHEVVLLHST